LSFSCSLQNGNDQGKFRQLDEILYVDGYPGYQNLMSIAMDQIQIICEVKGKLIYAYIFQRKFLMQTQEKNKKQKLDLHHSVFCTVL
jgi:hypothetical protein